VIAQTHPLLGGDDIVPEIGVNIAKKFPDK
jgi:hypothetical protein